MPYSRSVPNILIVDDIGANLKLLDDILKPAGYKNGLVLAGHEHCKPQKKRSQTWSCQTS